MGAEAFDQSLGSIERRKPRLDVAQPGVVRLGVCSLSTLTGRSLATSPVSFAGSLPDKQGLDQANRL